MNAKKEGEYSRLLKEIKLNREGRNESSYYTGRGTRLRVKSF